MSGRIIYSSKGHSKVIVANGRPRRVFRDGWSLDVRFPEQIRVGDLGCVRTEDEDGDGIMPLVPITKIEAIGATP